jgi:hypothetical protein
VSVERCGESLAAAQSCLKVEVEAWSCCEKERDGELGVAVFMGRGREVVKATRDAFAQAL